MFHDSQMQELWGSCALGLGSSWRVISSLCPVLFSVVIFILCKEKLLQWEEIASFTCGYSCLAMFIHSSLKMGLHNCPSTDEWVSKVLCIYRMEDYLAIKKNEIIKFSGKWTDLEKIMLREVLRFRMTNTACAHSSVVSNSKSSDVSIYHGVTKEIRNVYRGHSWET